ncbi:ankyrin repeat-containing domain protein, partial [Baffinella frigidus]
MAATCRVILPDGSERDYQPPLHAATRRGHDQVVRVLLRAGADVNLKDGGGSTPLHIAASHSRATVARVLLNFGACLDSTDNHSDTAHELAIKCGHKEVAQLLFSEK